MRIAWECPDKRRETCVTQTSLAELFIAEYTHLKTRVRTEDFSATLPGFGYSPEDEHREYSGQCGYEHHDSRFEKWYVNEIS